MISDKKLREIATWPGSTEVAQRLGVSRQWVHRLHQTGKLRGVVTAAGLILDPESVEQYAQRKAQ